MYSKVKSGTSLGIEGQIISVEADISPGLPGLTLVGYLSSSVKEAGERVRTALKNSGIVMPPRRVTINLSPADLRKDGTGFDLAIAVSILCSMQVIPHNDELNNTVFLGELGLDGSVRPINGVLPVVHYASKNIIRKVFVPLENAREASYVGDIDIIAVKSLEEVILILTGSKTPEKYQTDNNDTNNKICETEHNMSDVKGQKTLKRGLELAVAGFHNVIMTGAAGAGKSMLASCIPGIMPDLTYEESLILTKIYSVSGMTMGNDFPIKKRPFRTPHHTITEKALMGGGGIPRPGEVSLASSGVLFLDEFPEFKKNVLETLRQPMEDRKVTIARVNASYTFPADFMLVAAMNPCPCGHYPDRNKCKCTDREITAYQNRISYPIMDRIDIRIAVSPVSYNDLLDKTKEESSETVKNRIIDARKRQEKRFKNYKFIFNSQIPQSLMDEMIDLSDTAKNLIHDFYIENCMSARGYFRVLKLSRTIADLNDNEKISASDVSEALFYRNTNISGEENV